MTKKDYRLIAGVIRDSEAFSTDTDKQKTLATEFSYVLKADNPQFDRERFLNACNC